MPAKNDQYEELRERFRGYLANSDAEDQDRIKRGISLSQDLSEEQVRVLADRVSTFTRENISSEDMMALDRFGLSEYGYLSLVQTLTFLAAPMSADEPKDLLERAIVELLSLDDEHARALTRLTGAIETISPKLKEEAEERYLANAVLPSFKRLETTVDIRLRRGESNESSLAVPVIVCYLSTDSSAQRVWFQASKQTLAKLQKAVDEAMKDLEMAENYIASRQSQSHE